MHEVGIMQSAIHMAERQAREAGAQRILTLRLRVGAMSGVVPEALEFAFETLSRGTLADGGRLEVECVPPAAWCAPCRSEFPCADYDLTCPRCGECSQELRRGTEMQLSSIEIL